MTGISMRLGYADTPLGQVHYRSAGARDRTPLLLLHQTASSSAMFEPLMAALSGEFWLLAPDTPGFGCTPRPAEKAGIALYARCVRGFLDAMSVQRCMVFGHHTGASIAVQLAHDCPERVLRLALSGPTLLSAAQRSALPESAPPLRLREDGGHLLEMWQRIRAKDGDAPLSLSQRETLLNLAAGGWYREAYEAVAAQNFAGQLAALRCATLVFAGDRDLLHGSVEPSLALLRNGRSAGVAGAGTYICERRTGEVAALLRRHFCEAGESGEAGGEAI